jgi:hypothetical protein
MYSNNFQKFVGKNKSLTFVWKKSMLEFLTNILNPDKNMPYGNSFYWESELGILLKIME